MEIEMMENIDDNMENCSIDLSKVCRTCLNENPNLFEIDGNFLENFLFNTFRLNQIPDCENFPNQICQDCKSFIEKSYDFKNKIQECQSLLMKLNNLSDEDCMLNKDTQTDSTIYCCEQCDEQFLDYAMLKQHRIIHGTNNFKCKKCSKTYTRLIHLQQHLDVSHPELCSIKTKITAFVNLCDICKKQFSRKDHLKTHLRRVHKQEIKVINPMCPENQNLEYETDDNEDAENLITEDFTEDFNELEDDLNDTANADIKIKEEIESNEIKEELDIETNIEAPNEQEEIFEPPEDIVENENEDTDIKAEEQDNKEEKSEKCPEKLKTKKLVNNKIDGSPKKHQCEKCSKVFSRATHLKRHQLTHSDIKPFQCKYCEKRFTRSDHLNLHLIHHLDTKPFECDVCKKGFVRMEHLKKHKESQHSKDPEGNDLVKKEYCPICNKGFRTPKYLQIHMKSHSNDPKTLNCKYCDIQSFQEKAALAQHMKDKHAQFEKPFLCSECGLRFVRNDYLVIHMRRHRGEKPYKCKFCGKGFPRATDLTVHERYHTNEKTHLCNTCGKGFQRAYNLLVHMRVHTGERPYHCPHCIKSFAQGNDLKAHIRRHTGERYKCEICGDGFIQGYHLTHHKRSVHGLDVKSHIRRVEKFDTVQSQEKQIAQMRLGGPSTDSPLSEIKLEQYAMTQGSIIEVPELPTDTIVPSSETIPLENMMTIQYVQTEETSISEKLKLSPNFQ